MCLRSSRTAAGSVVPQGGNVNHCQSQIWRLNWVGPLCITANLCLVFPKVLHSHLHDTVSLTPFHQEKSHRLWSSLAPWSYLDTSPVRAKHLLLYVSYVASVLGEWLPQPSSQKLHHHQTGTSTLWPSWALLPPYPRKLVALEEKQSFPHLIAHLTCSQDMGATLCHAYPRFACLPAVYLPSLQINY